MFIIVLTIGIILLSKGYCGHNKHEFHISYICLATIAMFFLNSQYYLGLVNGDYEPTHSRETHQPSMWSNFGGTQYFLCQKKCFMMLAGETPIIWGEYENRKCIAWFTCQGTWNTQCATSICCARGTWLMFLSTWQIQHGAWTHIQPGVSGIQSYDIIWYTSPFSECNIL